MILNVKMQSSFISSFSAFKHEQIEKPHKATSVTCCPHKNLYKITWKETKKIKKTILWVLKKERPGTF